MNTAPPSEPGMPWANSSPESPASAANTASLASEMPAPALTRPPGSSSAPERASPILTTTASSPSSATRRFVPLPMSSTGTPLSCSRRSSAAASVPEAGQAISRAGPPMRKEQWALIGSFSCSSSPGRAEWISDMSLSVTRKAQYLPPLSIILSCSCASVTAAL